jgi:hypothetical protein
VARIRTSRSFDFIAASLIAYAIGSTGCTDAHPTVPSVTELPDASRRPDGVMIEPPPALPAASLRADARGVVALREPMGGEAVREAVLAFFAAFVREDRAALEQMLTPDASPLDVPGRGARSVLLVQWNQRMQAVEYGRLQGLEIVRPERIQRFEYDELGGAGEPARPVEMRPGDVFVRVPMEVSRVGPDRFFGETVLMVLRRSEGRFKIAAYGEVDH